MIIIVYALLKTSQCTSRKMVEVFVMFKKIEILHYKFKCFKDYDF